LRQTIEQKRGTLQSEPNPLEDLVKKALQPLLKEWLETHLPDIVETVVTREVQILAKKLTQRD
jgi:cell pole-organizing protein PopZ